MSEAADWMLKRLPKAAIDVASELPPDHQEVIVWISDSSVAIHHYPTVARRDRNAWWAGVPGKWIPLHTLNWTVTHWLPLPKLEA